MDELGTDVGHSVKRTLWDRMLDSAVDHAPELAVKLLWNVSAWPGMIFAWIFRASDEQTAFLKYSSKLIFFVLGIITGALGLIAYFVGTKLTSKLSSWRIVQIGGGLLTSTVTLAVWFSVLLFVVAKFDWGQNALKTETAHSIAHKLNADDAVKVIYKLSASEELPWGHSDGKIDFSPLPEWKAINQTETKQTPAPAFTSTRTVEDPVISARARIEERRRQDEFDRQHPWILLAIIAGGAGLGAVVMCTLMARTEKRKLARAAALSAKMQDQALWLDPAVEVKLYTVTEFTPKGVTINAEGDGAAKPLRIPYLEPRTGAPSLNLLQLIKALRDQKLVMGTMRGEDERRHIGDLFVERAVTEAVRAIAAEHPGSGELHLSYVLIALGAADVDLDLIEAAKTSAEAKAMLELYCMAIRVGQKLGHRSTSAESEFKHDQLLLEAC